MAAVRVTWRRQSGDAADRVAVGSDGLAMFALSTLLIVATGGLTYALAMLQVIRDAARRNDILRDGTWIVVLGMQLPENGVPGPEYQERLDHAAALLADPRQTRIAVLGGVTRPGLPSEADSGKNYLVRHRGIGAERVLCERRSHHTLENLRFYRDGSPNQEWPLALVTSRYHMARACLLARGLGLTVHPAPSDRGLCAVRRVFSRLPWEGLLIHWYVVGRTFARVTRNAAMVKRIS